MTLGKSFVGRLLAAAAALVLGAAGPAGAQANPPGPWGYLPESLPARITEEALRSRASSTDEIWGFIGRDFSKKDLSSLSAPFMALQAFDQETRWPGKEGLPASFDPKAWLEAARHPGLGVSRLHESGVTGAGVSIALIDKPIRASHSELAGRIAYTEVFGDDPRPQPLHFHGLACASILAGRSCGVAPGARLYYFAVPDNGRNFLNYSKAVDALVALNAALPAAERIRLVSISDGNVGSYGKEWSAALGKLREAGVAVVYSAPGVLSGFAWGGCPPFLDRDDPSNYARSPYFEKPQKGKIIIPADYRSTASNAGDGTYVYWGRGGYSWAMPYAAGLAALAWQLRPGLEYPEIEGMLRKTAAAKADGEKVVMPEAFIAEVRKSR
jgi:subtilisin family serine protease